MGGRLSRDGLSRGSGRGCGDALIVWAGSTGRGADCAPPPASCRRSVRGVCVSVERRERFCQLSGGGGQPLTPRSVRAQ
eukprot:COSAG01_NODE_6469_length_3649_cov_2.477746_6_plen_78_part_01